MPDLTDNTSYLEARSQFPILSLSLIFQPRDQRNLFADLLLYLHELDHVIHNTSESMLALMRFQWWRESILSPPKSTHSVPPLLLRLISHIDHNRLELDDLLSLINLAELSCQSDTHPQHKYWQAGINIMANYAGIADIKTDKYIAAIGEALYNSLHGQPICALQSAHFYATRYGKQARFLLIIAYLSRQGANRNIKADPYLIFKILWQVMIKPDRLS